MKMKSLKKKDRGKKTKRRFDKLLFIINARSTAQGETAIKYYKYKFQKAFYAFDIKNFRHNDKQSAKAPRKRDKVKQLEIFKIDFRFSDRLGTNN